MGLTVRWLNQRLVGWTAATGWLSSRYRPLLVHVGSVESINRDIVRSVAYLDSEKFVMLGHYSIGTGVRGLERTSSGIGTDEDVFGRG